MANYCWVYGVIHFTSPAGWLPVYRDQLRAQRSVTSMGNLYLLPLLSPWRISHVSNACHANVLAAATTARPECSCLTGVWIESLRARHADPDPAALAAGQLQNKVQAVLPHPRHPLWSQPGVSDGNGPVSRRQQITLRATLIFHLIDGLLSITAAHEVRRAGVLTCGSCHLERSARPHLHRGWSCPVPKTAEITLYLVKLFTFVYFCVFLGVLAFGWLL